MARLVSVNVGLPRDITWRGQTLRTAIWKSPVPGPRMVRRLNVDGDGQGDLLGHGGEHRAVMLYQTASYRYWEQHLRRQDFTFGQFGENFTVDGLADDEVCIGDRYRIGRALFEVTQPRVTCYRVGIRLNEPTMAALLVAHRRPGFYLRVLEEGEVTAGDLITKVGDGPERMTVADVDALLYLPGHSPDQLQRALRIPALSPGWQGSFRAMLAHDAGTGNAGLTTPTLTPAWSGFRSLRVASVDRESASVISLSFESADPPSALPAALPGQFVVVKVPAREGLPPLLRNYSLSNAPGSTHYRISVKQEPDGIASSFLHQHVKPGDRLHLSAPRGSFTLRPGTGPVVLLSAGIGATPVLAMLHQLAATASPRQVWWLHGARNGHEHSFADESRRLLRLLPQARSHIVYSQPHPDDQLGRDYDSTGHLQAPLLDALGLPLQADFYLCGPTSFLTSLTAALQARHVDPTRLHAEVFGPPSSVSSNAPAVHQPSGPAGEGPQISFTRSGLVTRWNPRFQSLLELAEACDVPTKWSCRTGVCHACESPLVGGEVNYLPDPLDPPAPGHVLLCCARPTGDLELDL